MKIYLISYSTPSFRLSQMLLAVTAKLFGVDRVVSKTQKDLQATEFYRSNRRILDQKRGAGYWLWKYYFIHELMGQADKGDVIIYADSAMIVKKSIAPLVDILVKETKGVLLFYNDYRNGSWTKRDCFIKLDCDLEEYHNSPQIGAQFQLFQKNDFSLAFVRDVLKYSCMDNLITDDENCCGKPNLESFVEHRHDQSITSLMAHKYAIPLYPDPSSFKNRDVIYKFPKEQLLEKPLYEGITFVHRLKGLELFKLPLAFLKK